MKTIKFPVKKSPPSEQPQPPTPSVPQAQEPINKPYANKDRQKLDQLVSDSAEVIYRCKNIFPFDFFPDQVIIDKTKIDLIYGLFFASKEVFTIMHKDLHAITMDYDLFFATIDFEVSGYEHDPGPIKFMSRKDALIVRRITLGIIASQKEGIDLSKLTTQELRIKLEEIGKAKEK
jgi:hypothetical protein